MDSTTHQLQQTIHSAVLSDMSQDHVLRLFGLGLLLLIPNLLLVLVTVLVVEAPSSEGDKDAFGSEDLI